MGREWKGKKGRGTRGGGGEGGKRREGRAPPIFYSTPSSSFLEICLPAISHYHFFTNSADRYLFRELFLR